MIRTAETRQDQDRHEGPATSPLRLAIKRFRRHRLAVIGFCLLALVVAGAVFAPWIAPYNPIKINLSATLQGPTLAHPFGTDDFGRDVFSRVLFGSRVSLGVGIMVVLLALVIGTPVGLVSGFLGGSIDNLVMRVMDALLTFPPLLLAVAIMGTLGSSVTNVIIALGIVYVPVFARLARGSMLAAREETYVSAAAALGSRRHRIIFRHVLPNILGPILIEAAVIFARAVLAEASLSFLGLGIQPPTPSWGRDLNDARRYIQTAWWLIAFPTLMLGISVLSINFIGDGLREALDPHGNR